MEDGHLELFFPLKMVIFHSFLYVYHVGYPWIFFQGSQGFQGRINALKEGLRKRTKKKEVQWIEIRGCLEECAA
jgi:hypothetical protein